ncbi:hypothetical protein RhiirC2_329592 [Rhizophagus irregularis]|uniref:Uncharacterized protein n=1 Tax=Rhizophagus irregularis TaxID=588596 RepID=A0A2N1NIK2_9GLOM|nr:hypothetical protein RhiirC2_329592 [Rhizophagus irregularis]
MYTHTHYTLYTHTHYTHYTFYSIHIIFILYFLQISYYVLNDVRYVMSSLGKRMEFYVIKKD